MLAAGFGGEWRAGRRASQNPLCPFLVTTPMSYRSPPPHPSAVPIPPARQISLGLQWFQNSLPTTTPSPCRREPRHTSKEWHAVQMMCGTLWQGEVREAQRTGGSHPASPSLSEGASAPMQGVCSSTDAWLAGEVPQPRGQPQEGTTLEGFSSPEERTLRPSSL